MDFSLHPQNGNYNKLLNLCYKLYKPLKEKKMEQNFEFSNPQEIASIYFNDILKKEVSPKTIEDFDSETISEFEKNIELAFPEEKEEVKTRLHYLIPYILQSIDWDSYGSPLQAWQLKYYYQRERFLKKTGLDYEKFKNHEFLMKALKKLGLEPVPTFEFVVFLKYYYSLRSELRYSSLEQLSRLKNALGQDDSKAKMDVTVNGRHFKFENSEFIQELFANVDIAALNKTAYRDNFQEGGAREKIRALDYYLVKTLLDYLPIKNKSQRGQYSQAERNFALSLLNYCGRLVGEDVEGICSQENNVTFDRLMRDFKGTPIPFAMELFL